MSIVDEIARIKGNIASAYTVAGGKGATLPAVQNSANLAGCIDTITGGGASSDEWQPNPNWWDIKKILDEDTRDYPGKVGAIIYAIENVSDFQLSSSGMTAVATSDGAFYTYADNGANVSHNWDTSKDKDDGRGLKTRWVIYYYTTDTTSDSFARATNGISLTSTSISKYGWLINSLVYLVLRINCNKATQFCYDQRSLEAINNDGYIISGGSFSEFCRGCYKLRSLPKNIDTSNSTDFYWFLGECGSLTEIPKTIDTSKGINFVNFLNSCVGLSEIPENITTDNGVNFTSFLAYCTGITSLPATMSFTNGTNFSGFLAYCSNIRFVPDASSYDNSISFSDFLDTCESVTRLTGVLNMSKNTVSFYSYSGFLNMPFLKDLQLILPTNTNMWLNKSTRISIESFRYIADHAPDVTATPRTLTIGSTNITRCNEADPTIITDLNAKGWTVA